MEIRSTDGWFLMTGTFDLTAGRVIPSSLDKIGDIANWLKVGVEPDQTGRTCSNVPITSSLGSETDVTQAMQYAYDVCCVLQ